jgi:hypothetical protein
MLPVTSDDARTWVATAFAAVRRVQTDYVPSRHTIEVAWTFAILWLRGYD